MTARQATIEDLDAIMTLEQASFPSDAWSRAMMREELSSPHSWYVVVEEAGRLVGYAGLRASKGASDADIQTITIAESSRGRGRGRALLTTLLAEAARRNAKDVFLEVRADNPVAQALYASEGFVELGRRPRYYQPDDVDAVVMRLDVAGWLARPGAVAFARDQSISPTQDAAGPKHPDTASSPELATPASALDAGACT